MARQYRYGPVRRAGNLFVRSLIALRVPPPHVYLLAVRGRQSGILRTTPVRLVEESGRRWLVAPYGEVNWVRNARATSEIQLKRCGRWESVQIREVHPEEAALVLKSYLTEVPIVRPFFDVTPASPLEEFELEAPRHPVFELIDSRRAAA